MYDPAGCCRRNSSPSRRPARSLLQRRASTAVDGCRSRRARFVFSRVRLNRESAGTLAWLATLAVLPLSGGGEEESSPIMRNPSPPYDLLCASIEVRGRLGVKIRSLVTHPISIRRSVRLWNFLHEFMQWLL